MDDRPNPPAPRRGLARAGLALAAMGLIATTVLAVPGRLVTGEASVFAWGNDLPRPAGAVLGQVMHLGSFFAAFAVALVAMGLRRDRLALRALLAWGLVRLTSVVMKAVVDRPRPPAFLADAVLRQHLPPDNGFPSGHSANAAALAVVLGAGLPRARPALAVVAVLVGVGRLWVGVHLPLDLVGGWCLGVLCGAGALAVVARLRPEPDAAGSGATGAGTTGRSGPGVPGPGRRT